METFAFIQTAVDYEDPTSDLRVRSLDELVLNVPNSVVIGAVAVGVAAATLSQTDRADALIRYGDTGTGVRQLQEQLGIRTDGIYGSATQSSVIAFQKRNNLLADGVAGPATLSALGLPAYLAAGGGTSSGGGGTPGSGGGEVPVSGSAYVTARIGLNIRSGPAGAVIGGLGYGERVALTGSRRYASGRYWAELASGGWVADDYLSTGGSSGGGEVPIAGGGYVTARIGLNVRNQPNGYVIDGLGYGQSVALSGAREIAGGRSWLQLAGGGWVAEDYIGYR